MKPSKDLQVALNAAEAGVKIIRKYFRKQFKIKHKGETNLVTEVDEKAQAAICKVIKKLFPNDSILAEEGDLSKTKEAGRRWIIDPIDGTTNFAHGYPKFCVSIALEEKGSVKCGVVHDPNLKEVFYAEKKKGAFVNGKRIHVSKIKDLKASLLVTGFPYDLDKPEFNNVPFFLHFLRKAQAIRRDGSAALNLAYVAAGRFDGFWELSLQPWDYAAGILLIQEAGGKIAHLSGRSLKMGDHAVAGSNPKIFQKLMEEAKTQDLSLLK